MTKTLPWQPSSGRPFIKVCGLTDPDNALACVWAGADMIGLVFFPKSPRHVSIDRAARISRALPEMVPACGVFVNADFQWIMERVSTCNLAAVQLHGNESPELVTALARENLIVIKALFASKTPGLDLADQYPSAHYFLLECGLGNLPGGNARAWDYSLSKKISTQTPVVLAGGLSPETVDEAIAQAAPSGVDVSSGVEKTPGVKDLMKVDAFVKQVQTCCTDEQDY